MVGTWDDSSHYIKKVDWRSTPLEWSSETLGGSSVRSGWDSIAKKRSTHEMFPGCKAEEEEEGVLRLLLEEAPLISLSGSCRGLTILEAECDLVCVKGAIFN